MQDDFEPLLCFARNNHQTPDEVFDMLQERMITMLGYAYQKRQTTSASDATSIEMPRLTQWRRGQALLNVKEFDKIGEPIGLSIADVLGFPNIDPACRKSIEQQINVSTHHGLDYVAAYVTIAALDSIDLMVAQRRDMIDTRHAETFPSIMASLEH